MNNPNPFLPQGAFLEQKNKARTRLKIAVFFSISLSVVVLMALLIQGCHKPNDQTEGNPGGTTDTTANTPQLTNPPDMGSTSNVVASNAPETNPPAQFTPPPTPPPAPPAPPVAQTEEYTVVKGDTFATIAKNAKVSTKAIIDANPGVDPKKLKIGQKLHIPASAATQSSVAPTAPMAVDTTSAGGTVTYKVKSGDTLTTIAKKYHVTIKAIQSANGLTTTSIKVGQALKIPGATAPAPTPPPVETTPPPVSAPTPAAPTAAPPH